MVSTLCVRVCVCVCEKERENMSFTQIQSVEFFSNKPG